MKNRFKSGVFALLTLFAMVSCSPQESDDYSLGAAPTADQLSFAITKGEGNRITLENTSSVEGVATWNFGNDVTGRGDKVGAGYPFIGKYDITMTLYTTGGSMSITQSIEYAVDDLSLLDTELYNNLCGKITNPNGKTWVFDQKHDGHFGVGPADGDGPSWWSCAADGKIDCSLYTQEFTFAVAGDGGIRMIWKNNGKIYTNEAGKNALGGVATVPGAGDFDVEYAPKPTYRFSINEGAKTLKLSDGAFLGHYQGVSEYQIMKLTEDELYVKCNSAVKDGDTWWYRFIPLRASSSSTISDSTSDN